MRGMALRPEDRPRRAGELAAELRAAAAGVPDPPTEALAPTARDPGGTGAGTRARPAPATTHRSGRSRWPRSPRWPLAVAAVALAFVLLSGGDDGGGGSTAAGDHGLAAPGHRDLRGAGHGPRARADHARPEPRPPETTTSRDAAASGPAAASRLNDRGYALLKGGDAGRRRARAPAGGGGLPGRTPRSSTTPTRCSTWPRRCARPAGRRRRCRCWRSGCRSRTTSARRSRRS